MVIEVDLKFPRLYLQDSMCYTSQKNEERENEILKLNLRLYVRISMQI